MSEGIIFFLFLALCGVLSSPPPAPVQLSVSYIASSSSSPSFGLDDPFPRFSWALESNGGERAMVQSAFELVVEILHSNSTMIPVWKTGVVQSNRTQLIEYNGDSLRTDQRYLWRVRWWAKGDSRPSPFAIGAFHTGVMNSGDWEDVLGNPKWIGSGDDPKYNLFRTEFVLKKEPERATAFICGLGYSRLFINGQRIGPQVLGAFTTFEKRLLYDTYDVTSFLRGGSNVIGVMLGHGWYSQPSINVGDPSLLFSLRIHPNSQEVVTVTSNLLTWKMQIGPVVQDDIYIGETYDARLETPGWNGPNYSDLHWQPVVLMKVPPESRLSSQVMPPITEDQVFRAQNLTQPTKGVFVVDFGQNIAGYCRIRIRNPVQGQQVTLLHAEELYPGGRVHHLYPNAPEIDNYIMGGSSSVEFYSPYFTYHGFRYVEVTGYPGNPQLDDFTSVFIHTALPFVGEMTTSSPLLNAIQNATRYSSLSNYFSIPTDCPQRERRGWLGDAHVTSETCVFNWDVSAAYTKFLRDIADAQNFLTTTILPSQMLSPITTME